MIVQMLNIQKYMHKYSILPFFKLQAAAWHNFGNLFSYVYSGYLISNYRILLFWKLIDYVACLFKSCGIV